MSASNSLAHILEINQLSGFNCKDWLRNLKDVLSSKKLGCVLDQKILIEILKSSRDISLEDISDLLMIEINLTVSSTTSWIIDSDSSVHLCTLM